MSRCAWAAKICWICTEHTNNFWLFFLSQCPLLQWGSTRHPQWRLQNWHRLFQSGLGRLSGWNGLDLLSVWQGFHWLCHLIYFFATSRILASAKMACKDKILTSLFSTQFTFQVHMRFLPNRLHCFVLKFLKIFYKKPLVNNTFQSSINKGMLWSLKFQASQPQG